MMGDDASRREVEAYYKRLKERYKECLARGDYETFYRSLLSAAKHNKHRRMRYLLDVLKSGSESADYKIHNEYMLEVIEMAVSHSSEVGHESLQELFNQYPRLLVIINSTSSITLLHIAVARQDAKGVEMFLDKVSKLENAATLKVRLFNQGIQYTNKKQKVSYLKSQSVVAPSVDEGSDTAELLMGTSFEAELPLLMAVWNTDKDTIDILIKEGTNVSVQNSKGDNLFHILIKASWSIRRSELQVEYKSSREGSINLMVEYMIHKIRNQKDENGISQLATMLNTLNNKDEHPLILSAKLGCPVIFDIIINCFGVFRFLDILDKSSNNYIYDITTIDSAAKGRTELRSKQQNLQSPISVLETIIYSFRDHEGSTSYEFTEKCPILNIIQEKWTRYKNWLYGWGFLHLLLTIAFSISSLYRLEDMASSSSIDLNATNPYAQPSIHTYTGANIVRAVIEIIFGVYCLLISFRVVWVLVEKRLYKQLFNPMSDGLYRIMAILHGLLSIPTVLFRFLLPDYEVIPLCLLTIINWLFLINFIRGLKSFSYFTVLMQSAIFGDMAKFLVVYIIALIAFTVSGVLLFQNFPFRGSNVDGFQTLWHALLSGFFLVIGLGDYPDHDSSAIPIFTALVFVAFILFTHVFLLNILIALLSETCSKIFQNKQAQWHLQKLSLILFIESHLPASLRHICGTVRPENVYEETVGQTYLDDDLVLSHSSTPRSPRPQQKHAINRLQLKVKVTVPPKYFSRDEHNLGTTIAIRDQFNYPHS